MHNNDSKVDQEGREECGVNINALTIEFNDFRRLVGINDSLLGVVYVGKTKRLTSDPASTGYDASAAAGDTLVVIWYQVKAGNSACCCEHQQ